MDNFDFIHTAGKFILTFDMLAGRLEIYAPAAARDAGAFWRR